MTPKASALVPMPSSPSLASLLVELRTPSKARLLAREPVTPADLAPARNEAWLEGLLRKGCTHIPLSESPLHLTPILQEGSSDQCSGFAFAGTAPDGRPIHCEFSVRSLSDAAYRAADRLVERGVLQAEDKYSWQVVVDHEPRPAPAPHGITATVTAAPLRPLSVPLALLKRQARSVHAPDDAVLPVFFTEQSAGQAERIARRGAAQQPPVETGGALAGPICSSDDGEFFLVVTHVLEAVEADSKPYSLEFTSAAWTRIRTVLKARQAAQPAVQFLGQTHGHNFLPNEGKTCEACLTREKCDLTNVFCSSDDREWTRAVFPHQPWALCLIYGLTARGDQQHALYTQRDGRLTERGYFVLPEFDADQWELKTEPALKPT